MQVAISGYYTKFSVIVADDISSLQLTQLTSLAPPNNGTKLVGAFGYIFVLSHNSHLW